MYKKNYIIRLQYIKHIYIYSMHFRALLVGFLYLHNWRRQQEWVICFVTTPLYLLSGNLGVDVAMATNGVSVKTTEKKKG